MPSWLVKLTGVHIDLQALAELFRTGDPKVTKEEESYYLRWSPFDNLSSPDQVRACAADLLWRVSALERVRCGDSFPVAADEVFLEEADGSRRDFLHNGLTVTFDVRQQHLPISVSDAEMFSRWLTVSTEDTKVEKALRIFLGRAGDWRDLTNILEVVLSDVGGRIWTDGWVSKAEVNRLTQTANSATALGDDARHGDDRVPPPASAMTHQEAHELIRSILQCWLMSK